MKSFDVIDAPQRSAEWFAARLGRVTGSRAGDVLASIKTGEAAARRDYRMELVAERLTGTTAEDGYVTADMTRGIELEPHAFALYEALTGQLVERSGFLALRETMAGCSLDGHVGDFTGLLEIKCPRTANHLANLRAVTVQSKYMSQIMHNLWVTGAAWCDFVSFDPRLPERLQMSISRVNRIDVDLVAYSVKVRQFLDEVELEVASLKGFSILQETA